MSDTAPPRPTAALLLPKPANDNRLARRIRAKVLISKDLPVTQAEIEVFTLLVDDLAGFAANDNEVQPE